MMKSNVRGNNPDGMRCRQLSLVVAVCGGLLLTACAHEPEFEAARSYKPVKVVFSPDGCPKKVVPDKPVEISRSALEGVEWEAIGPTASNIQVFFDPFQTVSRQFQALGKKVKSGNIAPGAPAGKNGTQYKYTIVAERCPDEPLDPMLIVKN